MQTRQLNEDEFKVTMTLKMYNEDRFPLLPLWTSIAIVTLSYSGIESAVGR